MLGHAIAALLVALHMKGERVEKNRVGPKPFGRLPYALKLPRRLRLDASGTDATRSSIPAAPAGDACALPCCDTRRLRDDGSCRAV